MLSFSFPEPCMHIFLAQTSGMFPPKVQFCPFQVLFVWDHPYIQICQRYPDISHLCLRSARFSDSARNSLSICVPAWSSQNPASDLNISGLIVPPLQDVPKYIGIFFSQDVPKYIGIFFSQDVPKYIGIFFS